MDARVRQPLRATRGRRSGRTRHEARVRLDQPLLEVELGEVGARKLPPALPNLERFPRPERQPLGAHAVERPLRVESDRRLEQQPVGPEGDLVPPAAKKLLRAGLPYPKPRATRGPCPARAQSAARARPAARPWRPPRREVCLREVPDRGEGHVERVGAPCACSSRLAGPRGSGSRDGASRPAASSRIVGRGIGRPAREAALTGAPLPHQRELGRPKRKKPLPPPRPTCSGRSAASRTTAATRELRRRVEAIREVAVAAEERSGEQPPRLPRQRSRRRRVHVFHSP